MKKALLTIEKPDLNRELKSLSSMLAIFTDLGLVCESRSPAMFNVED